MNNTKRSLIFSASFLLTTLFFALLMFLLPNMSLRYIFYLSLYFIMPIMFYLIRKLYIQNYIKNGTVFFSLKSKLNILQPRLILYVIIIFTEYKYYNTFSNINMYLTIMLFVVITEIYLLITVKNTIINFLNNSIIVSGIDFRIDIPLNDPIQSISGIYDYRDFISYSLKENILKLHLDNSRGTLSMVLPKDKVPHVIAFLQSKGMIQLNL